MLHSCEGSIPGECIRPSLRGATVERCFQFDKASDLQIVFHDPTNKEYDELYEVVESCPFCGYKSENANSQMRGELC